MPSVQDIVKLAEGLEGRLWGSKKRCKSSERKVWTMAMIEEYAHMYVILLPHMRQGKFRKDGAETTWVYDFCRREAEAHMSKAAETALQKMKTSNEGGKRKTGVFVRDPQRQPHLFYEVDGNMVFPCIMLCGPAAEDSNDSHKM